MSSYWAGYSATALVLSEKEYLSLIEKYRKENPKEKDEIYQVEKWEFPDQYAFTQSKYKGNRPNDENLDYRSAFCITSVDTDSNDGIKFIPYQNNGKPNLYCIRDDDGNFIKTNEEYVEYLTRTENCYFIEADVQLDSPLAFTERRYKNYEELLDEFKGKLEAYLPEDFDWEKHIGSFSYAAFA